MQFDLKRGNNGTQVSSVFGELRPVRPFAVSALPVIGGEMRVDRCFKRESRVKEIGEATAIEVLISLLHYVRGCLVADIETSSPRCVIVPATRLRDGLYEVYGHRDSPNPRGYSSAGDQVERGSSEPGLRVMPNRHTGWVFATATWAASCTAIDCAGSGG
jgi:hypothetical protein